MASTTGVVPETPERAPEGGSAAGSLTELAVMEAARQEKRQLLERAAETVVATTESVRLPAGCSAADVPALLQRYYWSEPAAEVLGHDPQELAELARVHGWELLPD